MHPAAESRAPRLNGPKRGPGSHPALCSGVGKEASSSPLAGLGAAWSPMRGALSDSPRAPSAPLPAPSTDAPGTVGG